MKTWDIFKKKIKHLIQSEQKLREADEWKNCENQPFLLDKCFQSL